MMHSGYRTMKDMRDEALIRAARRVWERNGGRVRDRMALARLTVRESAPGYFVQYEHAERMMRQYRQGRLKAEKATRRAMWEEIGRKVAQRLIRDPEMSYNAAVADVLCEEHASRFFLEPDTVSRVLRGCKLGNNVLIK